MAVRLGVCSWSLEPAGPRDLVERLRAARADAVQLHLDPLRDAWKPDETAALLREAGIEIASGMMGMAGEDYTTLESIRRTGGVRPDDTWRANLAAAEANAEIAESLGLDLVTFHAGFIPEESDDPERSKVLDRLRELRRVFNGRGVAIALETGQETAQTLLEALDELDGVGVNFDPANMILYGMGDPHEALRTLGPHVSQLHVKDATPTPRPGEWGEEVRVGEGAVDWPAFVSIADSVCPRATMMIEREAGDQRIEDIRAARAVIEPLLGGAA